MNKLSVKKLLLIAVFILIPAVIIYLARWQPNAHIQKTNTAIKTPTASPMISGTMPIPTYPNFFAIKDEQLPPPPDGWNTGDNANYQIKFPQVWTPITTSVNGGGTHVFLHPKDTDNQYFPRIDIESVPSNPQMSTKDRINEVIKFSKNASQTKTIYRDRPTVQMSEILPISDTHGHPVHKTYLFFDAYGYDYTITYAYFQDDDAVSNLQTILQILNSLTLK